MNPSRPVIRSNAELQRELKLGTTHEGMHLEFKTDSFGKISKIAKKSVRDEKKADLARETARDIIQFANSLGGTLLYGVEEGDDKTAWKVATGVSGVESPDTFMQFLDHSVRPLIQPSSYSFTAEPLSWTDGSSVVAVDAPPLATGIGSIWWHNDRGIEFYHRTCHGKKAMHPSDVEAHLMDISRRTYLLVLELLGTLEEQARDSGKAPPRRDNCVLASPVRDMAKQVAVLKNWKLHHPGPDGEAAGVRERRLWSREDATLVNQTITLEGATPTEVKLRVQGRATEAPLSRVSDIWLRTDGKIGLILGGTMVVPPPGVRPHFVYFEPTLA